MRPGSARDGSRRRDGCHLRNRTGAEDLGQPVEAFRGADRGGFGINPYGNHVGSTQRVNMDLVQTTGEWRQRGFYPILNREGTVQDRLNRSLLSKMVDAGYRHNQPGFSREAVMPLYAKRYNHQCPATPESLDAYLKANSAAGMPFGLPGHRQRRHQQADGLGGQRFARAHAGGTP